MTVRVHELAKELNIPSKDLVQRLMKLRVAVKGPMSAVDDEMVARIRQAVATLKPSLTKKAPAARPKPSAAVSKPAAPPAARPSAVRQTPRKAQRPTPPALPPRRPPDRLPFVRHLVKRNALHRLRPPPQRPLRQKPSLPWSLRLRPHRLLRLHRLPNRSLSRPV